MKSKFRFKYRTDIAIPNLDGMPMADLRKFATRAGRAAVLQSGAKADWLRLASQYAKHKATAMDKRSAGDVTAALRHERECEQIYGMIPQRMRW